MSATCWPQTHPVNAERGSNLPASPTRAGRMVTLRLPLMRQRGARAEWYPPAGEDAAGRWQPATRACASAMPLAPSGINSVWQERHP